MFYLMRFFEIIKKYPGRSIPLLVSMMIFFFILNFYNPLQSKIDAYWNKWLPRPYFSVIVKNKARNIRMINELKKSSSVYRVEVFSSGEMVKKLKKSLSKIEGKVPHSLLNANYWGIKVFLNDEVHQNAIDYLKDYILRFYGPSYVTFSEIKSFSSWTDNIKNQIFRKYSLEILASFFFLIGLIYLKLIERPFMMMCYLIEKFQRRTMVGPKIVFIFFAIANTPIVISAFIGGEFPVFGNIVIASIFSLILLKAWRSSYDKIEKI